MNLDEANDEGIRRLVKIGSEMTGEASATAIGFLLAGPEGGVLGAAAAPLLIRVIKKIGNDIAGRFLSEREQIRIGGVIIYATIKLAENFAAGKMPRNDGFFEKPSEGHVACIEIPLVERPVAEEILEGVLLAAQREHEEKKIPFLGNLLANIAFNKDVDKEQAYLLIKLCNDISFRQICLLALFADPSKYELRDESYREDDQHKITVGVQRAALLQEIQDLDSRGLLGSETALLCMVDINPKKMELDALGIVLYHLMELGEIDSVYLDHIASLLQ